MFSKIQLNLISSNKESLLLYKEALIKIFKRLNLKGIVDLLDQIFNFFCKNFGRKIAASKKGPFHLERFIK